MHFGPQNTKIHTSKSRDVLFLKKKAPARKPGHRRPCKCSRHVWSICYNIVCMFIHFGSQDTQIHTSKSRDVLFLEEKRPLPGNRDTVVRTCSHPNPKCPIPKHVSHPLWLAGYPIQPIFYSTYSKSIRGAYCVKD